MGEVRIIFSLLIGGMLVGDFAYSEPENSESGNEEIDFVELASDDELETLRARLRTTEGWPKVHAAEALLAEGDSETVRAAFFQEAIINEDQPELRIGIWRVLARAASDPMERQYWSHRIIQAFLDEDGPDRLHAIETVGKLKLQLSDPVLASVREYSVEEDCPFGHWVLWQHGSADSLARLQAMAEEGESVKAIRARYVIAYENH